MVDITPVLPKGSQVINSYGGGGFIIGGKSYKGSVIVFPDTTLSWNMLEDDLIDISKFKAITDNQERFEILLFGTGNTHKPIEQKLRQELKNYGIIIDVMNTGAACRTFNVLLSEERRVAAALISI